MSKGHTGFGSYIGAIGSYYNGGVFDLKQQQVLESGIKWPDIVRSGLVVYFEGDNKLSYPGSGSTWYDTISGKHATLTSVSYSRPNMVFNGSNSSGSFSTTGLNMKESQTIVIALKPTEATADRRNPYNHEYAGYGTITHETSGGFSYYHGTSGGNGATYQGSGSSFTVAENETAIIALTRGPSSVKWYKNGVLDSTTANSYPVAVTSVSTATIGSGYAGPSFQGNIGCLMLYTKELSAAEVLQNFQALRGRFGV
jgi:hypothetical protein